MSHTESITLYPALQAYIADRRKEFDIIPQDRKEELGQVADYIRGRMGKSEPARLTFICTHNSRRSHLSQIWAKIAAEIYGLDRVETFSGGTEATAFNPRAVSALQRCGLKIEGDESISNPRYRVFHSDDRPAQQCFSKIYDQPPNPTSDFCAVMTCSQADDACPIISGCDLRAPIRYADPKAADDTPAEAAAYDERSRQICREMLFMMSLV